MADPLAELLGHLERDGDVPKAWLAEHAPDGDLRPIWEACDGAGDLLALYAATGDRNGVVRAAAACAASVLALVPDNDPRPAKILATVAAFLRSEVDPFACLIAGQDLVEPSEHAAVRAAGYAACTAEAHGFGEAARAAVDFAAAARTAAPDPGGYSMLSLVRAHVPCPTLDQLRAACRRT